MNPQFPIYIVSKGRYDTRLTATHLEKMRVPYRIIVEESEYEKYGQHIDKKKILVLDASYQRAYDTCDTLGDRKSKGSGPARNFAWDHSISIGATWHWVVDDNIAGFFRYNKNLKVPCADGTPLACMEDFSTRFANVAMAGPHYFKFITRKSLHPPFILNSRIYSCNLIRNDIPFRWRARYNEDVDLSLRILKSGLCTILFNQFLQDKVTTQRMSGGNTTELYAKDGTLPKSAMIASLHPDVARISYRFNRIHHTVDYSQFKKNRLILKEPRSTIGMNEYNLCLMTLEEMARLCP